ncbi:MAG TPA: hypothetical protein VL988_04400 [Solirubrobacteraceae bacterium]|nr:hypothetical protein [Solirubrobacteraceae bacterium]
MQRAHLIRKLVLDSQYVIDEHLIAGAILARAAARRSVGAASFRNDPRPPGPPVRSFRPSSQARSFRPCALSRPRGRHRVVAQLGLL